MCIYRQIVWCSRPVSEDAWNRAMVKDPGAGVSTHPADYLADGVIFAGERPGEDGFVVSDAIAEIAEPWQRLVHVDAAAA